MADWRDVMHARSAAEDAVLACDVYGGAIEDGRSGDVSLAVLLAARAVCCELRALGTALECAAAARG
jgi:hypothetical protein